MRADYLYADMWGHVLAALMPPNQLALRVSQATGLRIGDVLNLRTEQLRSHPDGRLTVREEKTGKTRRIRIPRQLMDEMIAQAGKIWIWEGRTNYRQHRSRQAVYKDLKRAARLFRLGPLQISPHTARKINAVSKFHQTGSVQRVQQLLCHSSEAVTMLYAMADQLTERKRKGGRSA